VQTALLLMLAHRSGDVGIFVRDHALARADGLPEFVMHDVQFGNVLDEPAASKILASPSSIEAMIDPRGTASRFSLLRSVRDAHRPIHRQVELRLRSIEIRAVQRRSPFERRARSRQEKNIPALPKYG